MEDLEFLKNLGNHKIHWTHDNIEQVKRLQKDGYTAYVSEMYSGQWHLTKLGKHCVKNNIK